MENVTIPREKVAEVKNQDQGLTLSSKHRISSETLLPVWKRILFKIGDIFQVKAESVWKNEINRSKWQSTKWWYWQ